MVTFTTLSDINSQIVKLYLDLWLVICYYSIAAKSRAGALLVFSPKLECIRTRGTSWRCSTPRGRHTAWPPMRRRPAWPKPGAWTMPKGIRWVVLYAPTLSREGATPTILRGSRKRYVMQKHKKSLFMQDSLGNSSVPRTSHRSKFKRKWRKTVFRLAFKALEVLLVVLQIIQCFCEMFKK